MAQRDLNDLITSQEITSLLGTDIMHVGRPTEVSDANKDKAITCQNMFGVMNAQAAVLGVPSVPGDSLTGGIRATLTNYGTAMGFLGGANEVAGSITIQTSGVYRVNVNLICTIANADDYTIGCYLNWGANEIFLSGGSIPTASGSAPAVSANNLSGGTIVSLTTGDVLTLEVESDSTFANVTFPNGTFEIQPIFIA